MTTLEIYIKKFESLGCAYIKGQRAPHKPILILAVIDEISNGIIYERLIKLTPSLIERFRNLWDEYVGKTSVFKPVIHMPFYHLQTEGFWDLVKSQEYIHRNAYSLNQLKSCFEGAVIPEDLTELIQNQSTRNRLKECIINKYFSRITNKDVNMSKSVTVKTNSYFDQLLSKRGYEECPLPLWKLKINDEEYEELRRCLANETNKLGTYAFLSLPREACLFFGEFWRREYVGGSHSKKMVFDALNARIHCRGINYEDLLYSAAKRGARMLGIETFEDWNRTLDDLLYQGGLPMQNVITPEINSVWDRFTTGLVFRNIDFEQLKLGRVAKSNQGLRDFCDTLCDAVDKKQYKLMPYYCENESDPWYLFLLNKFSKVKRIHRLHKPFSILWEFDLNTLDEIMTVKYEITGQQSLSAEFLQQHELKPEDFISMQVKYNSLLIDSFDYQNCFCRYEIKSKHVYHNGDEISLIINDNNEALLTESLDLSVPHALYQHPNGKYILGNKIGRINSAIIVPTCWKIKDEENLVIKAYKWDNLLYRCILLPECWNKDIEIQGPDGKITFGSNRIIYWTEPASSRLPQPLIREAVYDVAKTFFKLCYELEHGEVKSKICSVKFRNKWEDTWSDSPSYGEIYARANSEDGEFVTSTKFINIGSDLTINILEADKDKCRIKIKWPHGQVFTACGQKQIDDIWLIRKDKCEEIHSIPFVFTPTNNFQNSFTITIKAPFKDFSILDENGNRVNNNVWIPYSDLNKFQYHLAGMGISKISIGSKTGSLKWLNEKLYLVFDNVTKQIPYEGPLINLLGSREIIRTMLDKTSQNMINAQLEVVFNLFNEEPLRFFIKESPYRPRQVGNTITILGNNDEKIDYKRALKLYKLKDPSCKPLTLYYDEINGYVLPESIKEWGKVIITGRSRGRICPALVEYNYDYSDSSRKKLRSEAIQSIENEMLSASFNDATWKRVIGWFNISQSEDLPASSFLDLVCAARNPETLMKLAFHLYCDAEDDEQQELLINRLLYFSNDLAFQWYWMIPNAKGIMALFNSFISDLKCELIMKMYVRMAQETGDSKYITAIVTDNYYNYCQSMLIDKIANFSYWIQKVFRASMQDAYQNHERGITQDCIDNIISEECIGYTFDIKREIDTNQLDLDEETRSFFLPYYEDRYSQNENWMMSRVKVIAKHLKGEINLFGILSGKSEFIADKIRRSLIFCYKMTQRNFVFELNKILSRK